MIGYRNTTKESRMYFINASGLSDKPETKELVEDAKSALYRAAELGAEYPIVLVFNALQIRGVYRKMAKGKALVKVVNTQIVGDI